ncbi:MAG: site-specific integrase [Bacteroidales bacterium]|nr:site-specific integrase [Bacteroidales bacterium]
MIKINYNTSVFLKPNGSVIVRTRWDKKNCAVDMAVGVFAEQSKWDTTKQCAKPNNTHRLKNHETSSREINRRINEFLSMVDDVFEEFMLTKMPSTEDFKKAIKIKQHPEIKEQLCSEEKVKPVSLRDVYQDYYNEKSHTWEKKTRYRYEQAITHSFDCRPGITIDKMNKSFMIDLVKWYINNNYSNDTTNSRIDALKSILRWAVKNGYKVHPEALTTDTELLAPQKRVIFMKYEELIDFYNFKFPPEMAHLDKYRDMFCFMAFTGLRYSDMINLKKIDIHDNNTIELYTEKTDEHLIIPLIPEAQKIVEKYNHNESRIMLFPYAYNQKINVYIKDAARAAGITREVVETHYVGRNKIEVVNPLCDTLSCHDARRTFVCCSLSFQIPATTVMKITGHEDYDSMKPYIGVTDETVKIEMLKWQTNPLRHKAISMIGSASIEQIEEIIKILSANNG